MALPVLMIYNSVKKAKERSKFPLCANSRGEIECNL
jgi:hypothetical protein